MTTLQEAARDALEALERIGKDFVCRSAHHAKKDQHSAFAECPVVVRHTDAIESLRTALAQQEADKSFQPDWVNYRQGVEDGKAEALAQQELPQKERLDFMAGYDAGMADAKRMAQQWEQAKPAAYITDTEQGPMVWTPEMYDEACTYCDDGEFPMPLYTAAPKVNGDGS